MLTGSLVTTAVTADQVIATKTVGAGKQVVARMIHVAARLTTFAATATLFGTVSLEVDAVKKFTFDLAGPGIDRTQFEFPPLSVGQGQTIRVVCTPAAATSMTWKVSLTGVDE